MTTYETQDGWNLENITPLGEFVEVYENISNEVYELNNCVRTRSLVEMRDKLLEAVKDMEMALEQITDNDTLKEEEE